MRGKQTHFFANKEDLQTIFQNAESHRELKYVRFGLFGDPNPPIYESFLNYEDLGINKRGQASNADIMFLVMDKDTEFWAAPVPQIAGGTKYAIDQRHNQAAICLTPSGFYDKGTLIAGKIGTISGHPDSLEIFNLFRKIIKKNSSPVGYARVCTGATGFLDSGGRMVTMGVDSPREYDLRILNKD